MTSGHKLDSSVSVEAAEALALRQGLAFFAKEAGIWHACQCVELDALGVVYHILARKPPLSNVGFIIADIIDICELVQHNPRSANQAVDIL
ncbi:hypothetical protein JRO89_XS15G0102000 [Xanthoceras sorbifolium]|uniref:RNase H type-1 domain-containing protein n=1 Tax=Xanthoceras sorbifolium TaxID=99658 RepID=A0ABQ8H1M7_9ROSI|nr:hypothetical protein JRO89_XS15G0102000 [Xanthoceras sorbifolium]